MKNPGKIFEDAIKKSVPDYCLLIRLPDPPHSFEKRSDTRFAVKNPCDYICYDSINRVLYTLELKSTKGTSMSVEFEGEKSNCNKMIKRHQVNALTRMSKYNHVVSGLLLNFRDEFKSEERTYFMFISDFNRMMSEINKKSCNEKDILQYGGVIIRGIKKRINYRWDIDGFFKSINR